MIKGVSRTAPAETSRVLWLQGALPYASPARLMRSKMEVELGIADLEGVVVTVERGIVVEQERQAVVHPNRREMAASRIERQAEDVGEEPGGGYLVTRRHDGVVQDDGHGTLLSRARLIVPALGSLRRM
jgi:hypothetical protein